MRVVTWNCNMAFRKKTANVLSFKPDILVLQECERPEKVLKEAKPRKLSGFLWFGDNPNKGLAILSFNGYKIAPAPLHNNALKHIVPVKVEKGNLSFHLLAVWANNPADKDGPYVAQVWKAVQYYKELLAAGPCILMGDFNSNSIWDKQHKGKGHSAVVGALHSLGIVSCYHHFNHCSQGEELHPTHYLYRHEKRPYHLDYCFVSDFFLQRLQHVEVGTYSEWKAQSDHVPIFLEFSSRKIRQQLPIN
ncbi:MAG: endonuclease/exonuclease/phosphatase family protein [Bacteroidota bacterium]|nr:endonuclease/exonuclease/phosphatase family protein [Bacteroidota bacterium]